MIRQFRANCIQLVPNFPTGFRIRIIQKPERQTHDVFPGSELSHSLVNMARWLTGWTSFGQAGQRGPEFQKAYREGATCRSAPASHSVNRIWSGLVHSAQPRAT
jgi:hypothetical protein